MSIDYEFLTELRRKVKAEKRGFQAELCRILGKDPATFSNMISGRRECSEEDKIKLSQLLGIDYAGMVEKRMAQAATSTNATNSHQINAARTGSISIKTNHESGGHQVVLSDLEHEVLVMFRKYGNQTILERCLRKLREAQSIFG